MVQSCDTWYAVHAVERVIYNTCDHFGLKCEQPATCALEQKTLSCPSASGKRKPAGRPWMRFKLNLNGSSYFCVTKIQRPLTYIYIYIYIYLYVYIPLKFPRVPHAIPRHPTTHRNLRVRSPPRDQGGPSSSSSSNNNNSKYIDNISNSSRRGEGAQGRGGVELRVRGAHEAICNRHRVPTERARIYRKYARVAGGAQQRCVRVGSPCTYASVRAHL